MDSAIEVVERHLIRVDVSTACSPLNGHVAERHPLLHRQNLNGRASEFIGITNTALNPERADHMEHQILGGNTIGELAIHLDSTHFQLVHRQALTRENITHLTGADTESDGTERTMGGGVRVATRHGHPWLSQTQLWSDHMHDSLSTTAQTVQDNAVLSAVTFQRAEHLLSQGVFKWALLGDGGDDVIDRGNGSLRTTHGQSFVLQGSKGLGAGDFMDQMQTHEQLGGSTGKFRHPMQIPHLVVKGAGTQQSFCAED